MINDDEAAENAELLEAYFNDLGWDESNRNTGLIMAGLLLTWMYDYGFPITNKRFPEVLRGIANLLELRFVKKDRK